MGKKQLRTREDVLAEFERKGISVRSWAIANGVSPSVTHAVLKGKQAGRIGEGHKVAVLLGLKHGEIAD